jgi:hypothetical protein
VEAGEMASGERLARLKAGGYCAAGKRGEQSGAFEAGVLVPPTGALGARFKLAELRLLPRDWASTRPSDGVALNLGLE